MAGLTESGFEKKTLAEIESEIEDSLRTFFGVFINLLPGSVFKTLVGIFAEREAAIWDLAEHVYSSMDPDKAVGAQLDAVVAMTGTSREPARRSHIPVVLLEGQEGTLVPAGTVFAVSGNPEARFVTDSNVVINSEGKATVTATAEEVGPISAPTGTLTEIVTPVAGLDSVTNDVDAVLGRDVESDAELRIRRNQELQKAGAGNLEAIRSRLKEVENVNEAIVFENATSTVDVDGRPPKSIQAYVDGGLDQAVGDRLWEVRPAGIETVGETEVQVEDSQGITQTVKFSRPVQKEVYVVLDIETNDEFPADGEDQIKAAILAFGATLGIGEDVLVYPRLLPSFADAISGLVDIAIKVGFTDTPTEDSNLGIAANEIAKFDSDRITVNEA